MRVRKAFVFGVLALVLIALGVGGTLLFHSPNEKVTARKSEPVVTTQVESKSLQASVSGEGTFTTSGSAQILVGAPSGMLGVVTKNLLNDQDSVSWCEPVAEVSGRPIFVLPGAIPAYRDLSFGDQGDDVRRLQQALKQCGLLTVVDGDFGILTERAVELLYKTAGYQAVRDSTQALTPVDTVATGEAGISGTQSSSASASSDKTDAVFRSASFVNAKLTEVGEGQETPKAADTDEETANPSSDTEAEPEKPSPFVAPRGEIYFFSELPTVSNVAKPGTRTDGQSVVTLNFAGDFFDIKLSADQKLAVAQGQTLEITYGDWSSEATLPELPVSPKFDDQGNPYFPVRIELGNDAPQGSYDNTGQFLIDATSSTVFETVIPVSALYQTADGTQYVLTVTEDATTVNGVTASPRLEQLTVTVLESASGYVAVEPVSGQLVAGDTVAVGSTSQ